MRVDVDSNKVRKARGAFFKPPDVANWIYHKRGPGENGPVGVIVGIRLVLTLLLET